MFQSSLLEWKRMLEERTDADGTFVKELEFCNLEIAKLSTKIHTVQGTYMNLQDISRAAAVLVSEPEIIAIRSFRLLRFDKLRERVNSIVLKRVRSLKERNLPASAFQLIFSNNP